MFFQKGTVRHTRFRLAPNTKTPPPKDVGGVFYSLSYMTRLVSNMIPVCGVVTKITLMKATSRGGQPYAKFMFEAVDELGLDETKKAKAFGQKFAEILNEAIELEDRAVDKAAG